MAIYNLTIPSDPAFRLFKSKSSNNCYVWGDVGNPRIRLLSPLANPFDTARVWECYVTKADSIHGSKINHAFYLVDVYSEKVHEKKLGAMPPCKLIRECPSDDYFLLLEGMIGVLAVFPELNSHRRTPTGQLLMYRLEFDNLTGK